MCMNPDELKAFALVHDPEKRILYEVDAQPTGSTVRMTNVAARVDDPAGVTRMDVSKASAPSATPDAIPLRRPLRRWTGTSTAPRSRRSTSTRR
jgi:hypothetical protein